MIALEFPPINEILRWKDLFPTFNKIALIAVAAALIGTLIFLLAGSGGPHPTDPQVIASETTLRQLCATEPTGAVMTAEHF
mgnify:CR=1 FL=1